MALSDRQIRRVTEERVATINEVNTTTGQITMVDHYGTILNASLDTSSSLTSIPMAGEIWIVQRRNTNWYLVRQQKSLTDLVSLSPGDRKLSAPNNLYFEAQKVFINGHERIKDVRDFGAKGDNKNDDTVALQAAINAAQTAGGGTVFMPPGIYLISSQLTIPSQVTLSGSGPFTTEIKSYTTGAVSFGGTMIYVQDAQWVTIQNLSVQGVGITGSNCNGIWVRLVSGSNNKHITLRNVRAYNMAGFGVKLETPIMCVLENVRTVSTTDDGIFMNNGTSTTLISCYVGSSKKAGYHFDTMSYSSLIACASEGNGISYWLNASNNNVLQACGCETSVDISSTYPGTHFKLTGGTSNSLFSCYAREFGTPGADSNYYLDLSSSVTSTTVMNFRGTATTNGPTNYYNIASGSDVMWISNTFSGPGSAGIGSPRFVVDSTQLVFKSASTSSFAQDRSSTTNFGNFIARTAGVDQWAFGLRNDSTNNFHFRDSINGRTAIHLAQSGTASLVGVNNVTTENAVLHVGGSVATAFVAKTAAYTATVSDSTITGDATGATFQITLPSAASNCQGRHYTIKRINSGANSLTVGTTSSQTIDGATTKSLDTQWAFISVVSDGANWIITAQGGTVT